MGAGLATPSPPTADEDQCSDRGGTPASAVPDIVMAEQTAHDVVNQVQSVGDSSSIDVSATQSSSVTAGDGQPTLETASAPSQPLEESSSPLPTATTSHLPTTDGTSSSDQDNAAAAEPQTSREGETGAQIPSFNDLSEQLANGNIGEETDDQAPQSQTVGLDAGLASDTDISRPDSVDQSKEVNNRHERSNSVKKPLSFRAISVTKNFLAKSTAGTPAAKLGDKATAGQGGSPAQSSAKPRLVAKAGLRDAAPRPGGSGANGNGNAIPDASKVWNKNRPVPPPPPKHFTDEELKQQYGIHLATRLQADEAGAKWADIDDDEDDWAPETVEWMDGTKSTIGPVDQEPVKTVPPKPNTNAQKPPEAGKAVLSIAQRPAAPTPGKTILKPGNHTAAAAQAKTAAEKAKPGNVVLKGAPDKGPTLVAKTPAPVPVKSPWAPLPPIDKVPPVEINPPPQPKPTSKFGQPDPHGFDAMPPPPPQAKEIAADDFDRSWRESDRGTRELYNSQSGRYEPVKDIRRSSVRDGGFRQPSLLQRPMHSSQQGPAEPSAAFQTSRTSVDGAGWGRRRTSSNVSAGDGPRPAVSHEAQVQGRRGSQGVAEADASVSPGISRPGLSQQRSYLSPRGQSPATSAQVPWTQQSPSATSATQSIQSHANGQEIPDSAPSEPVEDPIVMQKRLMRERMEAARKRRQEQEEQEEAARKERIRIKMESLGMAPLPEHKEKTAEPVPTQIASQENIAPELGKVVPHHEEAAAQQEKFATDQEKPATQEKAIPQQEKVTPREDKAVPARSPKPSPKVPLSSSSESKQPDAGAHRDDRPTEIAGERMETVQPPQTELLTQELDAPSQPVDAPLEPSKVLVQPSDVPVFDPTMARNPQRQDQRGKGLPGSPPVERHQQPWQTSLPGADALPGWGANAMKAHSTPGGNVWGSPLNDKGLGNGTFTQGYHAYQTRQSPYQQPIPFAQPVPGPIAPPLVTPSLSPAAIQLPPDNSVGHQQRSPNLPPPGLAPQILQQTHLANITPHEAITAPISRPGPVAAPALGNRQNQHGASFGASAWKSLPAQLAQQEGEQRQKAAQEHAARLELEARTGAQRETQLPVFRETYRQTVPSATLGKRHVIGITKSTHQVQEPGVGEQLPAPTSPSPPYAHPIVNLPQMVNGISAGPKPSRFFGPQVRSRSPSPPPPESSSHPAHSGAFGSPRVNLPKPKAQVKLPPAPRPEETAPPVIMPHRPSSFHGGARPLVATDDWRARFEGLLGTRQPQSFSPPRPQPSIVGRAPLELCGGDDSRHSLPVTSASKMPLEVTPSLAPAMVMLPHKLERVLPSQRPEPVFAFDDSSDVVSKPMVEPLLEEREFGSLPWVNLPPKPTTQTYRRPYRMYYKHRHPMQVDPVSINTPALFDPFFDRRDAETPHGLAITIKIPSSRRPAATRFMPIFAATNVPPQQHMPSRQYSNRRSNRTFQNENSNRYPPQGMRPSSGNFQATQQHLPSIANGVPTFYQHTGQLPLPQDFLGGSFGPRNMPYGQNGTMSHPYQRQQNLPSGQNAGPHSVQPYQAHSSEARNVPQGRNQAPQPRVQRQLNGPVADAQQPRPTSSSTPTTGTPTAKTLQQKKPSTPNVPQNANLHLQQKSLQKRNGSLRSLQATQQTNPTFSANRFATLQNAGGM